jgi:hypothetical protein
MLYFAKISIFSKHWTSLFTPDTVGLMIHALLAFISILASAFRHRQGLAKDNVYPYVATLFSCISDFAFHGPIIWR